MFLQFIARQRDYFSRSLIQVDRFGCWGLVAKERVQSRNYVSGAIAVAKRVSGGFGCAGEIRRVGVEHPEACSGVGCNTRKGLVDFVSDRRRQLPKTDHPGYACEFRSKCA